MPDKQFRLNRPALPQRFRSDRLDALAAKQLARIADKLGEQIWPDDPPVAGSGPIIKAHASSGTSSSGGSGGGPSSLQAFLVQNIGDILAEKETKKKTTLSKIFQQDGKTGLLYEVEGILEERDTSYNESTLLQRYPAILHFLFARAVYVEGLDKPAAIAEYLLDESELGGQQKMYLYVADQTLEEIVREANLDVGSKPTFRTAVLARLANSQPSLAEGVFSGTLRAEIDRFIENGPDIAFISKAAADLDLTLSNDETDFLAKIFQDAPIQLTDNNARYFVSNAIERHRDLARAGSSPLGNTAVDYSVSYHEEPLDAQSVNVENVRAAAQLFYVMTLGDELEIFKAVDLLVNNHLSGQQIDIQDAQLLADLQRYVLDDEFVNLRTGKIHRRTHAEERKMFYRQVFNLGDAELMEGMGTNPGFEAALGALLQEAVRYISDVSDSFSPANFVSRSPVIQAITDLQYNLSTYCSGMAKASAPVFYAELDFIIERILSNPQVVSQLALQNSKSYYKVVERVLGEHHGQSVPTKTLREKAIYGHQLLEEIATASPHDFSDDDKFSRLISIIDTFIATNEKLELRDTSAQQPEQLDGSEPPEMGIPDFAGVADEWNF